MCGVEGGDGVGVKLEGSEAVKLEADGEAGTMESVQMRSEGSPATVGLDTAPIATNGISEAPGPNGQVLAPPQNLPEQFKPDPLPNGIASPIAPKPAQTPSKQALPSNPTPSKPTPSKPTPLKPSTPSGGGGPRNLLPDATLTNGSKPRTPSSTKRSLPAWSSTGPIPFAAATPQSPRAKQPHATPQRKVTGPWGASVADGNGVSRTMLGKEEEAEG